jgi:acyl dehydratase
MSEKAEKAFALFKQVEGSESATGDWMEIDQQIVNQFADVTHDHQFIHVDPERAKATPFGGPIAHGFLTLSLLPALTAGNTLALEGVQNAVNYGADGLRFLAPVPAGSNVHARSKLVSAEAKGSGTLIKSEIAVHVVGAEKPSLVYQMLVLYMG